MQAYAETNGLEVVESFIDIASAIVHRPQFEQMLKKIAKGEINGILCINMDRLFRNFQDGRQLMQLIDQKGLRIITKDGEYGNTAKGKFLLELRMNLVNFYRNSLSESIKRGILAKKVAVNTK